MTALQAGSIGRGWWQSLPSHRSALSKAACRDSGLMNVGRLDGGLDRILFHGILNYVVDAPGYGPYLMIVVLSSANRPWLYGETSIWWCVVVLECMMMRRAR